MAIGDAGVSPAPDSTGDVDLDSWSAEMSAVRQAAVGQFVRVLFGGFGLLGLLVVTAGLVNRRQAVATRREQYAVPLKPADGIAIVVGVLVLVATVNIAIAVMDLPVEQRERMRVIAWQRLMSLIAQTAGAVGFAMGAALWLATGPEWSWPGATAATALGVLGVALASAGSWRPKDAALLAMERRSLDRRYELVRVRLNELLTVSKSSTLPEVRRGWTNWTLASLVSTAVVQSLALATVVGIAEELGHNVDSSPRLVYGVIVLLATMLVAGNVVAALVWSAWLYRSRPGLVFAVVILLSWAASWLIFASSARTVDLTSRVVFFILSTGIVVLPFITVLVDRVVPSRLIGAVRLFLISALATTKAELDRARQKG